MKNISPNEKKPSFHKKPGGGKGLKKKMSFGEDGCDFGTASWDTAEVPARSEVQSPLPVAEASTVPRTPFFGPIFASTTNFVRPLPRSAQAKAPAASDVLVSSAAANRADSKSVKFTPTLSSAFQPCFKKRKTSSSVLTGAKKTWPPQAATVGPVLKTVKKTSSVLDAKFSAERDLLRRIQCAMRVYEDRSRALFDSWDGIVSMRGMNMRTKSELLEDLLRASRDDFDKLFKTVHQAKLNPGTSSSSLSSAMVMQEPITEEEADLTEGEEEEEDFEGVEQT